MPIKRSEDVLFKQDGSVNTVALLSCVKEHEKTITRLSKLKRYYDGEHDILKRKKKTDLANRKLVVNHAEYITDFATAYFIGNPVKYSFSDEEERTEDDELLEAYKKANIEQVDTELSRDISIYGIGIEFVYQDKHGNTRSTNLDPRIAFVVMDDTVEENYLLGVHKIKKHDENGKVTREFLNVFSESCMYVFEYKNSEIKLIETKENLFGMVPFVEYWNKLNQKGDFESVLELIDAYNLLQSDRINDKEQFVDSLLVLYGTLFGDTTDEKVETAKRLRELGLLELSNEDRVEYVSKTFNETEIEILKTSLTNDIHKISKVPNLTDENFAGNSSGVAMRYKLLGLEQLAQTKEKYFRIGLKERLRLYSRILSIKAIEVDIDDIQMTFSRSLPVNELETAQLVSTLQNQVSQETLISLLPFVEDVKSEIEKVTNQKLNNIQAFQGAMGGYEVDEVEDNE